MFNFLLDMFSFNQCFLYFFSYILYYLKPFIKLCFGSSPNNKMEYYSNRIIGDHFILLDFHAVIKIFIKTTCHTKLGKVTPPINQTGLRNMIPDKL